MLLMLVSELKKVIDIDSRITSLHQELATLYLERQQYIKQNNTDTTSHKHQGRINHVDRIEEAWSQNTYDYLVKSWEIYGIKIPALRALKKSLYKAHAATTRISSEHPEVAGKLGVLLVPPAQILGQPGEHKYRQQQPFVNLDDYLTSELAKRYQQKNWRLFIVYLDEVPMNLGKAKDILSDKKYLISGYDTRGLGVYEYYALSLQSAKPLDQHTWTLLLKGYSASTKTVASVTFINGQYRVEIDDTDGVFGDERFRPAVEIASL